MTSATLQINQAKLFEACNHDPRLTAIMLAVAELVTGDRVKVDFAHQFTNRDVAYYRDELLRALGIDTSSAA